MPNLDPTCLYESGSPLTGLLTRALREVDQSGVPLIKKLMTEIKNVATADGTIASVVSAATTLETQFGTAATVDKVVQPY